MKKTVLILVLVGMGILTGCSIDDGPALVYNFAEITDAQLPETFETGKRYNIPISYKNPSTCDIFYGFDIQAERKDSIRHIYIYAITYREETPNSCQEEGEETDRTLRDIGIGGSPGTKYVLHFWNGSNEDEASFLEKEIFVRQPETGENEN